MSEKSERDLRLDFCRGLALIVIFIDHVPGNPLADWTLHNFSFCDAAEIFVLISGIAAYLAYGSRLSRAGFGACAKAAGRNCLRIYVAHLVLIGLIAGSMIWVASQFPATDYIGSLKLQWFVEDPKRAIWAAMTLSYLPRLMDILPMYILFLIFAPALIVLVKRDYRIALLVSAIVYALAWGFSWNLSAGPPKRHWYFDPFAWQFLYTVGITVSHLSRDEPDTLPWRRGWLWAAIAFLAVTVIITWPLNEMGMTKIAPLSYFWPANKTYLAPLRVLNVLALLYVFAYCVSPRAPWLKKRLAGLCISCGRHSLTVYGLGMVLSCVGYVAIEETASKGVMKFAVNVIGLAILVLTGVLLDRRNGFKREALRVPALRMTTKSSAVA
jgi:hypothetical protein